MSDEQDHWDTLQALLAATPIGANVYDYGKVPGADGNPGELPDEYVLLTVERRYVPPTRAGGTDRTGWRATTRYVGLTAVNARKAGGWVRGALERVPGRGKRITIDGVDSTPLTHESANTVAPDGGRYSGLSQWTYAL